MATFKRGPRGGILKITRTNGRETITRATKADIKNMSTAQKIKLGTRTKGGKFKI